MTTDDDIRIPDSLAAGLRRLHEVRGSTDSLDEQVLGEARRRLRGRPVVLRRLTWVGVAAAVALTAGAWLVLGPGPSGGPTLAREDVDGSGRVDILDAYLIARSLRAGTTDPAWDLNGDGVVDGQDVDAAAMASVRLEGETS